MRAYYILISFLVAGCISIKPTERISYTAPEFYPEGITFDAARNVFYVTSARKGIIGKVTRDGKYAVLLNDTTLQSSYGIKVHPDGKRLFVCSGDANYSKFTRPDTRKKRSALITIDIESGKKLAEIDLASLTPGKHFANDLTFDHEQNAYVTDSYAHAIYKISADGTATIFSQDKQFVTEGIGINGIVFHPDGFLLVNNSNRGLLYKVDIKDGKKVTKVKLEQYFLGADGMVLNNDKSLTMVVNGGNDKIYALKSSDGWQSAKLAASTLIADRFTYPTTATSDGKDIWVSNGKFTELNDSTSFPARIFAIQHAKLKPLP